MTTQSDFFRLATKAREEAQAHAGDAKAKQAVFAASLSAVFGDWRGVIGLTPVATYQKDAYFQTQLQTLFYWHEGTDGYYYYANLWS